MKFVPRKAIRPLRELLGTFPCVLVVGPRQSGKSTLAQHACRTWLRIDLERPADLASLGEDLEGFFTANPRQEPRELPSGIRSVPWRDVVSRKADFGIGG